MAGGHQFTEIRDLAFLERLNGCCGTGYFAYDVAGTLLGNRVGNSGFHFFPVVLGQLGEELDGFHFADLLHGGVALADAVVVCAAVQMMRAVGIGDDHFDAIQFDGHVLELEGVAVEVDSMIFLSLRGRELVHDAAHDTCVLMLASLTDESQLRAVRLVVRIFPAHLFGEGACGNHLHGRGTAQPCSCGNVTIVEQVITALQFSLRMAATDDLEASQRVVTPSAIRLRSDSVHRDLIHLGHVQ